MLCCYLAIVGRYSSVGIATGYRLDGSGIEFRWERDFPYASGPCLSPTQLLVQWVPVSFPGVKRPELGDDHTPILNKEERYTSTPSPGLHICSRVKFTFVWPLNILKRPTKYTRTSMYVSACSRLRSRTGFHAILCIISVLKHKSKHLGF